MNKVFSRLQPLWKVRAPEEKRALAVLAAVLLIALTGHAIWSVHQSRQQLRQQLPKLASAAESMHQQFLAWQSLSEGSEKTPISLDREETYRRLSSLDGTLKVSWRGEEQLAVSGEVAFASWLREIGELQHDYQLIVTRLQALPAGAGRVALEAELARSHAP